MSEATTRDGPRRLCPQGLPTALRGVHHQRDLPRGASRRPAPPLRHQGGRRGRPPRRRTPGADAARVPPAADIADQGAAAALARAEPGAVPPRGRPHRSAPPRGSGPSGRPGTRPGGPRTTEVLGRAPQALRPRAPSCRGPGRPARPGRGRGPDPRPLRARNDDGHLAGLDDHRPAVLVHRPRQGHLHRGAQPCGPAAAQDGRRLVRRDLHRGQPPPPGRRSARARRCTCSTTA